MIAGEGSSREALVRQAATALPGVCTFLGHVDDVTAVHEAMDLFVQSSDYEGTPNAVLEAMALESPIVATAGGTAEVALHGQHALIVEPGDAGVLARAIDEALSGATRRRPEGLPHAGASKANSKFAARMRRVEDIYRELVREGGPRRRGLLRWS